MAMRLKSKRSSERYAPILVKKLIAPSLAAGNRRDDDRRQSNWRRRTCQSLLRRKGSKVCLFCPDCQDQILLVVFAPAYGFRDRRDPAGAKRQADFRKPEYGRPHPTAA